MRLDLVLTTEAVGRMATGEVVGLVGEDREDTESLGVIYILNRYNKKPECVIKADTLSFGAVAC